MNVMQSTLIHHFIFKISEIASEEMCDNCSLGFYIMVAGILAGIFSFACFLSSFLACLFYHKLNKTGYEPTKSQPLMEVEENPEKLIIIL